MPPYSWADEDDQKYKKPFIKKAHTAKPKRKKPYIPPIPAKPCVVGMNVLVGMSPEPVWTPLQHYQSVDALMFGDEPTQFPSRREAYSAVWHTLEYYKAQGITKVDGSAYHANDFEIRNA